MNSEWITCSGKKDEIIKVLEEQMGFDKCAAEKILAFLSKEKSDILCSDEIFQMNRIPAESNERLLSLMIMEYNYYINIRASTIFLLSTLIDSQVHLPVVSLCMAIKGMKRLVEHIEEDSGMKCILLEILRQADKKGKDNLLEGFKGECCNNHLECRFQNDGQCRCTAKDTVCIMEKLKDIGILKKKGEVYQYDPIGSL